MALTDIIAAVMSRVPNDQNTGAPVPSFLGPEFMQAEAVPPRLVWVPADETYGPAERIGDDARSLRTRLATLELHIWGGDYAATELLLNQTLAAVHGTAAGSYELGKGMWMNHKTGPATDLGRVYVVQVTFKIPVTAAPPALKTVTTIPVTTTPLGAPTGDAVVATLRAP